MSNRSSPSFWFEAVPGHWETAKLKHLASFQSGDGITVHSIDGEGDYPVYGGNGLRGYTSSYTHDGDYILVGRQGALCGNVNYASGKFWASEHAVVVAPRPTACLRWLGELLLAMNLGQYSQSAAQPGLSIEYVVNLPVPVPPLAEQRAIAGYLDRKAAEIDVIVAKKGRLIELLRQERQALISRAVTQGLDATAPMKESGVPWLGVVPKHWLMVQLKFLSRIQTGITLGKTYSGDTLRFPYLRVANVQDGSLSLSEITEIDVPKSEADRCMLRAGDVLLTEGGDLDKLGRGTVWSGQIPRCLHQNHVFAVRPATELLLPEFLAYQTKAKHGREYFTLTGQKTTNLASTNTTKVGAFPIPLPTIHEQRQICAHIDRETSSIDGLIEKNEQQIAKLREYRQTLISAAVTGKFTVPAEETPDFRAAVLAAEIIYSHPATKPIGRTKLHKELYATEHECDLVGIDADYARMPFGPYDDRLQKAVERELEARQWYRAVPGERGKVNYVPLAQAGQHRAYFDRFYGDKAEAIARLVGLLRPLNKNKIERAITLYAAWNDFLIRGEPVDDGRLLTEVQKNWHPEKQHKEESWRESLGWLKARKLIPHGFGKPTRPTNVFTGLTTAPEDDGGEADESEEQ